MSFAQTLVLAPSYEPIGRCSWRRAITLWYLGKVAVESEYDEEVCSVSFSMKTPAVVRYFRGPGHRRRRIRISRENIYLRDQGRCGYCGRHMSRASATYDHVIPRAQGGQSSWGNLVLACVFCNKSKAARTPEQAGMRLRETPAKPTIIPDVWTITVDADQVPEQWHEYLKAWAYWNQPLDEG